MKYIGWFSCGSTSSVACKLAMDMYGTENVDLWYIDTGASHSDNDRFIRDCENWYGKKINIARNPKFNCPLDVESYGGFKMKKRYLETVEDLLSNDWILEEDVV